MNTSQADKAVRLRALHDGPGAFVIANAFDAGSARMLARLGFAALATSSGAAAGVLGRKDGELSRDEALAHARAIAAATDLPVSADLENGFGHAPEEVAETIRLAGATGIVGASIEDYSGDKTTPLYPIELAKARIVAAVRAARELPFAGFSITARAENFFRGPPDLADTIARLRAYEAAGADVLFAPALPDLDAVRAVCAAVTQAGQLHGRHEGQVVGRGDARGRGRAPHQPRDLALARRDGRRPRRRRGSAHQRHLRLCRAALARAAPSVDRPRDERMTAPASPAAPPPTTRCDRTPAWAALGGHYEAHGRAFDLREAFARDPQRVAALSFDAPEVFADLSKNLVDVATVHFLAELARECGVEALRDAMFAGAAINTTEGRAVLHTALRAPPGEAPFSAQVHAVLDALLEFAEAVRARADAAPPARLRHVVNIGIGGSDLGPQMAVRALAAFAHPGLTFHFVANVDGDDIASVLAQVQPDETLFLIASKTFTTQETLANAATAKAWFLANGGTRIDEHFAAATSNVEAAARFGITRTFGFWDWVGGRYSLWSAIGLPIAIAIGAARFRELLAGAHAMDRHFARRRSRRTCRCCSA